MRKNRLLTLFVCAVFLASCAGITKIDPTAFIPDAGEIETIPDACKASYERAIPRVAVVNFTNNTTFDYAQMVQANVQGSGQKTAVGGAAVGVAPGAAGIVWGQHERSQFEAESQTIQREVNAKLSESVEDGVTDVIVNIGGAQIFSRSEMQKIIAEHKFQQSGLVDTNTLVQLGKFAGVKFIITGSINNVVLTYKSHASVKSGLERLIPGVGSIAAGYFEAKEGWNVSTEVTLRILDVETGEIVFSDKVMGTEVLGQIPYPNFDTLIGGIKSASSKGLNLAQPKFAKYFSIKGYILQTKTSPDGKQRVALINIGEKQGLKPGMNIIAYTFQEIKDPFSGKSTCDIVRLPVELEITNQLQTDKAWVLIKGEPAAIKRVKAGQLVEKAF